MNMGLDPRDVILLDNFMSVYGVSCETKLSCKVIVGYEHNGFSFFQKHKFNKHIFG